MELVKEDISEKEVECCPIFRPEKWEGKVHDWNEKKFIMASLPTFFHIPLPPMIGKKVNQMMKLAENANRLSDNKEDVLLLFTDPTAFKSQMYLSVTGLVPEAENVTLNGTFASKVFDGPFNSATRFMKEMTSHLEKQGEKVENFYVHYAYCPKCAKKSGHNYMVLFAQLK